MTAFTDALTNPYAPKNVTDSDASAVTDLDSLLNNYDPSSKPALNRLPPVSSTPPSVTPLSTNATGATGSIQPIAQEAFGPQLPSSPFASVIQTFEQNILDAYENITYNFKLAMAPEAQLLNPNTNPTGPYYIVAQSGVSANFYINDVDIESIVSPNAKTRNVRSTVFTMTIIEPQGISLIDKLLATGKLLGIKNINICPMLLELSFQGFTATGIPTAVPIAKRTWRIQLQDITTRMNEGGANYVLTFMILQDYAFNRFSAASIIQQQLTFPVDTVGQFFDDLSYYLTLQATRASSQGQIARSEYEFNVDPEMRSWKIGEAPEQKNAPSVFIDEAGKRSIVLGTNMTIDRIVDVVLSATKEGNLMVNPDSTPEKLDQQPTAPKVCKVASVNGKVEFLGYNQQANDYVRKYTYYINRFDSFRALIDTPDQENEEQRIQYLIQDSLKKKYEYIFTGQNTSVLNLDLDLNTLWRFNSMYYAGALQRKNNTNSKFIQPEQPTTSQDDLREKAMASTFACTVNNATGQPDPDLNARLDAKTPEAELTDPRTDNIQALDKLSETSKVQNDALRTTILEQDVINGIAPVEAADVNQIQNLPVLVGGLRLDSSVTGQLIETIDSDSILRTGQDGDDILTMFTKQIDTEIDSNRVTENLEETTDLGRSIYGVVTDQLYNDQTYANLLKIDMTIRGDPFWLGESDIEVLNRLDTNTTTTPGLTGFANYLRGENCFFLTFKTPQNFNDNTGFVDVKNAGLFVGVYSVIRVLNTFSDGKFTQKLEAIRDLQSSAKTLRQYIQ